MRLRSTGDDYAGDRVRQQNDLANTAGALHSLALRMGELALKLLEVSQAVDSAVGATHVDDRVGDV